MLLQYTKFISKFDPFMAKQTGPLFRTGTIGPVTYYKLFGEHYYMRSKSCLDSERFYKDPAFAGSRKRSKEFGGAAALASHIYKLLPKANRGRGFMGKFIGRVHILLMAGYTAAEIQAEAVREYGALIRKSPDDILTSVAYQPNMIAEKRLAPYWIIAGNGQLQQLYPIIDTSTKSDTVGQRISCATCVPPG